VTPQNARYAHNTLPEQRRNPFSGRRVSDASQASVPVRVSESLQGERDRIALVGRDVDLDQLPSAGGTSDETHRPAGHRDCLGNCSERSFRCPADVSGLDDANNECAVVFAASNSL